MAYFIFTKNLPDVSGTLYRIAENQIDLDSLNIDPYVYKIIQDSNENFNSIKLNQKEIINYNSSSIITYQNSIFSFKDSASLKEYIDRISIIIDNLLKNNTSYYKFQELNTYYNEINNLNLTNISYPLQQSLEEYLNNQGKTIFNILQLP